MRQGTVGFFATIQVVFKHVEIVELPRELLKMSLRKFDICAAHSLSTLPRMLSGPAAFRGLTLDRVFLTSSRVGCSACSPSSGVVFLIGVPFCTLNRAEKLFRALGREESLFLGDKVAF